MWYDNENKIEGDLNMKIRLATPEDIPALQELFEIAREFQIATGNPTQWAEGYPSKELMLEDINKEAAYVGVNDEQEIVGALSVFTEPDPTYFEIEGEWLNDDHYTTIHRIATNGKEKGVGQYLINWVQENYNNVRIDTHIANEPMKHVVKKLGFEYTGVIYVENGDARNAYQFVREEE